MRQACRRQILVNGTASPIHKFHVIIHYDVRQHCLKLDHCEKSARTCVPSVPESLIVETCCDSLEFGGTQGIIAVAQF
jgi:hypothetical protein